MGRLYGAPGGKLSAAYATFLTDPDDHCHVRSRCTAVVKSENRNGSCESKVANLPIRLCQPLARGSAR